MTDVCCGKNLCQNKIRWSIILRYGLHILFTRRYHLPQANFDQEHFVIWKWFVYHHFCDKCSSWTQNNLLFHSITVKTPSPVNLYYCFYYYKDTVSRLQCISHFYSLNRVACFLAFRSGSLAPLPHSPALYHSFGGHGRSPTSTTRRTCIFVPANRLMERQSHAKQQCWGRDCPTCSAARHLQN